MHEYLVIFEQAQDGGWGAYAPDLPGLGVAAETREEVAMLIRKGLELHIAGLKEDGLPIPPPSPPLSASPSPPEPPPESHRLPATLFPRSPVYQGVVT